MADNLRVVEDQMLMRLDKIYSVDLRRPAPRNRLGRIEVSVLERSAMRRSAARRGCGWPHCQSSHSATT